MIIRYQGISYAEFKEQTDNFAFGLAALGIVKNDKVAIIAENRPEWVYSDMAILALGAIDIPIYPSLTAESIEFILNNSESKGVIISTKFQLNKILKVRHNLRYLKFIVLLNEKDISAGEKFLYTFNEVKEMGKPLKATDPNYLTQKMKAVKETDLCTIIYTSGTTGEPKGVMLTHKNILSNVTSALENYPIDDKDIFLSFLPLCHIFERMGGYYTGFFAGAQIYFAESIESIPQNMLECHPTIMTSVPRLFERINSKIIKNVDSQPLKKQKIFYWAMDVGVKYNEAKKKGSIPYTLSLKNKIADKLVFSKLREKTGGKLRFFISGGAALPLYLGKFFEAVGLN